jgi:hypothetical protein
MVILEAKDIMQFPIKCAHLQNKKNKYVNNTNGSLKIKVILSEWLLIKYNHYMSVQTDFIIVSDIEHGRPSSTTWHYNTYKRAVNITYYCEIDSDSTCAV